MNIRLENVGKKFEALWIFRHINYDFLEGEKYAITGLNGSGKSTLAKIILKGLDPSEGLVKHFTNQNVIHDDVYIAQNIAFASPYMHLPEDLTVLEILDYSYIFSEFVMPIPEFLQYSYLEDFKNKRTRHLSSGTRQRLKLAMALLSQKDTILLDEPCSNMDEFGKKWYLNTIQTYNSHKLIIVASNEVLEYSFSNNILNINSL